MIEENILRGENNKVQVLQSRQFCMSEEPKEGRCVWSRRVKGRVVQDEMGRVRIRGTVNHCQET